MISPLTMLLRRTQILTTVQMKEMTNGKLSQLNMTVIVHREVPFMMLISIVTTMDQSKLATILRKQGWTMKSSTIAWTMRRFTLKKAMITKSQILMRMMSKSLSLFYIYITKNEGDTCISMCGITCSSYA